MNRISRPTLLLLSVFSLAAAISSCSTCKTCADCPAGVTLIDTAGNEIESQEFCAHQFPSKSDYRATIYEIERLGCECQ